MQTSVNELISLYHWLSSIEIYDKSFAYKNELIVNRVTKILEQVIGKLGDHMYAADYLFVELDNDFRLDYGQNTKH